MDEETSPRFVDVDSPTEERNPRTQDLDAVPSLALLRLINAEDQQVPLVVSAALPEVARLVDAAAERVARGGRVHYVGAGTSGRLAVIDAAELRPTFNLEAGTVRAHLAGGRRAMFDAVEGAEDDGARGAEALEGVRAQDVVIGIAASGRTPFVVAALERATRAGALTALITSNTRSLLAGSVDVPIVLDTGPEALTGSTRLKAATAQKLVLHSFSTALMVRLGRTWSNLMVSVVATNDKLRARTVTILEQATGEDRHRCEELLDAAAGDLKVALVTALWRVGPEEAREALGRSGQRVRDAGHVLMTDGLTTGAPTTDGPTADGGPDNRTPHTGRNPR